MHDHALNLITVTDRVPGMLFLAALSVLVVADNERAQGEDNELSGVLGSQYPNLWF
jgi:hypothetical protein